MEKGGFRLRVRQRRDIFTSPEDRAKHVRRAVMYITGVLGLGAGASYLVYLRMEADYAAIEAESSGSAIPAPESEFVHPYRKKPWYWKVWFAIKRCLYLAWVFAPVSVYFTATTYLYPDSPDWRAKFVESLLHALEMAGCGFMKLGQWISMRPDMFPPDITEAMGNLRTGVTPHSFADTEKAIKECFGKDIEELFEEFDPNAIASGTVAQVWMVVFLR